MLKVWDLDNFQEEGEIEANSRQATKAKAMQFSEGVSESPVVNSEIKLIRSQLEQMSTILKGANSGG